MILPEFHTLGQKASRQHWGFPIPCLLFVLSFPRDDPDVTQEDEAVEPPAHVGESITDALLMEMVDESIEVR